MSNSRTPPPHLQVSQTSLQDALRRALRDEGGRAAVRVAPGPQPEAQRLVFALLREASDVKGGSLLEITPNDWLLTELPIFEAGKLQTLLAKILGEASVALLPLPASKNLLAGLLHGSSVPQFLEVPTAELVSPLGLDARLDRVNLAQIYRRQNMRQILGGLAEDRALLRHAEAQIQKRVLEALGDEGTRQSIMGGGPIAPLFLDLPLNCSLQRRRMRMTRHSPPLHRLFTPRSLCMMRSPSAISPADEKRCTRKPGVLP